MQNNLDSLHFYFCNLVDRIRKLGGISFGQFLHTLFYFLVDSGLTSLSDICTSSLFNFYDKLLSDVIVDYLVVHSMK